MPILECMNIISNIIESYMKLGCAGCRPKGSDDPRLGIASTQHVSLLKTFAYLVAGKVSLDDAAKSLVYGTRISALPCPKIRSDPHC